MKTQTFGMHIYNERMRKRITLSDRRSLLLVHLGNGGWRAIENYRSERENGTDSDNPPDQKFPQDGKVTWIKGTVKEDGYVYGVKESDGCYHYEVRYDEGPKDREWMQEKDKRYLARLEKEGKLEKEEPEEFKKRQAQSEEEGREKVDGQTKGLPLRTRIFGIYTNYTSQDHPTNDFYTQQWEGKACEDYKSKRKKGTNSDKFPQDGKIVWIKGTVKEDGYVYGAKESDGYYHYEVRYNEGPQDREWMQEKDKRYLVRLEKEELGKIQKAQPEKVDEQEERKKRLEQERYEAEERQKKAQEEIQRREEEKQVEERQKARPRVKTQTFGIYTLAVTMTSHAVSRWESKAVEDYRSKGNSTDFDKPPDKKFPQDGKITWIKGTVRDGYVYGVKESDEYYHYEVRYDEGPKDREWMQEKDKRCLARLEKECELERQESEEFRKIQKARPEKVDEQEERKKRLEQERYEAEERQKKAQEEIKRREEEKQVEERQEARPRMKTQTFGKYSDESTFPLHLTSHNLVIWATNEYRSKRGNGTDSDNPKAKFPQDGKITWVKGTVEDGCVNSVKESDGYYHYEVRYDEGPKDHEWMQEKDKRYFARLEKEGKLEEQEPEEFQKRQKEIRQREEERKRAEKEKQLKAKEQVERERQLEEKIKQMEEREKRVQEEQKKKLESEEKKRLEAETKHKEIEAKLQEKQSSGKKGGDSPKDPSESKSEDLKSHIIPLEDLKLNIKDYELCLLADGIKIEPGKLYVKKGGSNSLQYTVLASNGNKITDSIDTMLSEKLRKLNEAVAKSNESTLLSNLKPCKSLILEFTSDRNHTGYAELGRGTFGVVYKGTWECTIVAIKQSLNTTALDEEAIAEFTKEAETMSKLSHPHVLRMFGVCIEPGHYHIVTEFMPHGSLNNFLRSDKPITWGQIWNITYQIGAGIRHLHKKGIELNRFAVTAVT